MKLENKVKGLRNYLNKHPKTRNAIIYGTITTLVAGAIGFYALDRYIEKNLNFNGISDTIEILTINLHPENRDTKDTNRYEEKSP